MSAMSWEGRYIEARDRYRKEAESLRQSLASKTAEVEALKEAYSERVAQLTAHRACCGSEHDPAVGKFHGCCVICGTPWPCEYAGTPPAGEPKEKSKCDTCGSRLGCLQEAPEVKGCPNWKSAGE